MATPLLPTPRVVSQGTLRQPKGQPKPRLGTPLLPTPKVVGSGSLRKPKNPWK